MLLKLKDKFYKSGESGPYLCLPRPECWVVDMEIE